jgi:peptidoglycan/LPS O-acetylase OafA/YrhL
MPKAGSSALDTPAAGSVSAPEGRVFHTLDALRGIAAVGVVVFHMSGAFAPIGFPGGYLAVDLFFMMSGVVLSHAYEARFRAGMGTVDFMRVRLIRLYPLYLVGALLGIAVTVASLLGRNSQNWDASNLWQATLLALLFLPSFAERPVNQLFPLNIPCWSLFLELLVNLLFVVAWPLLSSRRLILVSAVTGIVVGAATWQHGNVDQGSTVSSLVIGLARTLFGFGVGILIARHVRHLPRRESNIKVLAIAAVFGVAIAGQPAGEMRAVWDLVCVLVVFPVLVLLATRVDPGARLRQIATFLGLTSYAVYVLHGPLSSVLNSVTRDVAARTGMHLDAPWLGIGSVILLLAGCWLVDRCFDSPVRRLLGRVVPRTRASSGRSG